MQKIIYKVVSFNTEYGCNDIQESPIEFEVFLEDPYKLGGTNYKPSYVLEEDRIYRCELGYYTELLMKGSPPHLFAINSKEENVISTSHGYLDYKQVFPLIASKKIVKELKSVAKEYYLEDDICRGCNLLHFAKEMLDSGSIPTHNPITNFSEGRYKNMNEYITENLKKENIQQKPDKTKINKLLKEVRESSHVKK